MTVAPEHIQRKGRLAPGKLFLVDLEEGRVVEDDEVKRTIACRKPYGEWYEQSVVHIGDLPDREPRAPRIEPLRSKQLAFGYSQEDLRLVIAPMAANGEEPVASMGNDAALAVLSDRQPPLLAVAAVHHHLGRRGTRLRTGLVIESGEPRTIHHMATLIGYGAAAINPYVMFESLDELADHKLLPEDLERDEAEQRIVRAI